MAAILLTWLGLLACTFVLTSVPAEFCGVAANCDLVLHSRFSQVGGLPVVWAGVLFYITLMAGFLCVRAMEDMPARRMILHVAQWIAVAGALVSAALMFVQFAILRAFCPMCTLSAVVAISLCLLSTFDFPARPGGASPYESAALFLMICISLATVAFSRSHESDRQIVLSIDGRNVTEHEMREGMGSALQPMEQAVYRAKLDWIEKEISAAVLASEAQRRGLSVAKLIETEVDSHISVFDREASDFLKSRGDPAMEPSRTAARAEVLDRKKNEELKRYVDSLKQGHHISVRLAKPALRLASLDRALTHTIGPEDARVQLVVFSDFQCHYCASLAETLKRIREVFPKDVLIGFRHFPVEGHPRAWAAAEAAECAFGQGKFWAFHDELFAHGGALEDADLRRVAKTAGLDEKRFEECLLADVGHAAVEASYRDGLAMGIEGTPSLFLNGKMIGGVVKYADLAARIREELTKQH